MTLDDFHMGIVHLFSEANKSGLDIGDIYQILNGQTIIAETILKLSIENAYKERFNSL
jgi:hypothetical protein